MTAYPCPGCGAMVPVRTSALIDYSTQCLDALRERIAELTLERNEAVCLAESLQIELDDAWNVIGRFNVTVGDAIGQCREEVSKLVSVQMKVLEDRTLSVPKGRMQLAMASAFSKGWRGAIDLFGEIMAAHAAGSSDEP